MDRSRPSSTPGAGNSSVSGMRHPLKRSAPDESNQIVPPKRIASLRHSDRASDSTGVSPGAGRVTPSSSHGNGQYTKYSPSASTSHKSQSHHSNSSRRPEKAKPPPAIEALDFLEDEIRVNHSPPVHRLKPVPQNKQKPGSSSRTTPITASPESHRLKSTALAGSKDAPAGSRGAAPKKPPKKLNPSAKAQPHAFISRYNFRGEDFRRLEHWAKKYSPSNIVLDEADCYIFFPNTSVGLANLDALCRTNSKPPMLSSIQPQAFPNGSSVSRIETALTSDNGSKDTTRLEAGQEAQGEEQMVVLPVPGSHLKRLDSTGLISPNQQETFSRPSSSGGRTVSSEASSARKPKCHVCLKSQDLEPVYKCSTCSRRYHRFCHPQPKMPTAREVEQKTWQCKRCVKKGVPPLSKLDMKMSTVGPRTSLNHAEDSTLASSPIQHSTKDNIKRMAKDQNLKEEPADTYIPEKERIVQVAGSKPPPASSVAQTSLVDEQGLDVSIGTQIPSDSAITDETQAQPPVSKTITSSAKPHDTDSVLMPDSNKQTIANTIEEPQLDKVTAVGNDAQTSINSVQDESPVPSATEMGSSVSSKVLDALRKGMDRRKTSEGPRASDPNEIYSGLIRRTSLPLKSPTGSPDKPQVNETLDMQIEDLNIVQPTTNEALAELPKNIQESPKSIDDGADPMDVDLTVTENISAAEVNVEASNVPLATVQKPVPLELSQDQHRSEIVEDPHDDRADTREQHKTLPISLLPETVERVAGRSFPDTEAEGTKPIQPSAEAAPPLRHNAIKAKRTKTRLIRCSNCAQKTLQDLDGSSFCATCKGRPSSSAASRASLDNATRGDATLPSGDKSEPKDAHSGPIAEGTRPKVEASLPSTAGPRQSNEPGHVDDVPDNTTQEPMEPGSNTDAMILDERPSMGIKLSPGSADVNLERPKGKLRTPTKLRNPSPDRDLGDSGKQVRRRVMKIGGENLGNSYERPKGTYEKLIGLAMSTTPDGRMQARGVCNWVANNIPHYRLGIDAWESGIGATLSIHEGIKSKQLWDKIEHREGESEAFGKGCWYALKPGIAETLARWDAATRQAVYPSGTEPSGGQLGNEPTPRKMAEASPHEKDKKKKKAVKEPKAMATSAAHDMDIDTPLKTVKNSTKSSTISVGSKNSQGTGVERYTHRPRPMVLGTGHAMLVPVATDYLVRGESMNVDYTAKSLWEEWPDHDPDHVVDIAAKMHQIKQRPTRKEMFKKHAMYSRIHETTYSEDWGDLSSSSSERLPSRDGQPERSGRRPGNSHGNYVADDNVKTFRSVKDFLGIPHNPVATIKNGQLVYREGLRDEYGNLPRARRFYETGL